MSLNIIKIRNHLCLKMQRKVSQMHYFLLWRMDFGIFFKKEQNKNQHCTERTRISFTFEKTKCTNTDSSVTLPHFFAVKTSLLQDQ